MPIGYTALKTVASMETVASASGAASSAKGRKPRGHAPGNYGKCHCCQPLCKVCGKFCRLSPLTQCLLLAVVAFFVVTGLMWIGGASLTGPANANLHTDQLCSGGGGGKKLVDGSSGEKREDAEEHDDPTVPLLRQNVYAWYLANTGIIVSITIFGSCVCCVSFVGLCCDLPSWAKICGAVGLTIAFIIYSLFIIWTTGGAYLIVTFDKFALLTSTCRNILIYEVFLAVYLVTVVMVLMIWSVWRARNVKWRARTTPRRRHRTKPQTVNV